MWPFGKRTAAAGGSLAPRREPRLGALRSTFAAASADRLTFSWTTTSATPDAELRRSLRVLRARSRQLWRDNDYAKSFARLCRRNIVGPDGIVLQSQAAFGNGRADQNARGKIEAGWAEWGRRGACTMDGKHSLVEVQQIIVQALARDGEVLVRIVRGKAAGNAAQFALHVLEADHLDDQQVEDLKDGRRIVMGIEQDAWGRPIAYHLLNAHPGDDRHLTTAQRTTRVPTHGPDGGVQILHLFVAERPMQSRGVPWMHAAMRRLNMLGGYEEAELVASRAAAAKMGFIETPDGNLDGLADDKDKKTGESYEDLAEPGTFKALPPGTKLVQYDPQHPSAGFQQFTKMMLRGAAAGLGVSYVSLATDLEGVNYSSIRQGVLEEREEWRLLQGWVVQNFLDVVFREWLPLAIASGLVALRLEALPNFLPAKWQGRRWQWVDPSNESKAQAAAVALGVKSRKEIAGEQGRDIEDVLREIAEEQELADELGVELGAPGTQAAGKPGGAKDKGTDDGESNDPAAGTGAGGAAGGASGGSAKD